MAKNTAAPSAKRNILGQLAKAGAGVEEKVTGIPQTQETTPEQKETFAPAPSLGVAPDPSAVVPGLEEAVRLEAEVEVDSKGVSVKDLSPKDRYELALSFLEQYPDFTLKPKTNVNIIQETVTRIELILNAHKALNGKRVDMNHVVNTILTRHLATHKGDYDKLIKRMLAM